MRMRLKQIHTDWPQVSMRKRFTCCCPSCGYSPWSSCLSTVFFRTPLNPLPFLLPTFKNFQLELLYFVLVLNLSNSLCRALYAPSGVSPAFVPRQQPTLVMLADKHTRKYLFVVRPFRPCSQRSSRPRRPCKDSFVVNNDETISKHKWTPGPQAGQREQFQTISPVHPPPRPPSDGNFTP
ncbi:hypothetical protein O181_106258 [Austropuccinia psidii MF-1]|uniref:Uncharacterized protein n=1 Tax=Austropuccinia psidii MF-1 TaxID=1389203 RepID=A0A9Q3JNM9_9BASI|nr:hypothetical protein [Austropuccinia psidii MF-1]